MIDPYTESERDFVDQLALVFESSGLPPIAGRIIGRLLICDPPHQSSTELADYLNASRGSISTATRMLITSGMLEKVRHRGDRASYFRIREGCWTEMIHLEVMRIRRLRQIAEQGLALFADDPERSRRLKDFRDFNAFFEAEFPVLVQAWDNRNRSKS